MRIGTGDGVSWYGSGNAAVSERVVSEASYIRAGINADLHAIIFLPGPTSPERRAEVVHDGCSISLIYSDTNFRR